MQQPLGNRTGAGQQVQDAAAQTLGRDDGGGINAHPAAIRLPHFDPGMGVGTPHQEVTADGVPLTALVAGHDARRHAPCAHEHGECRGEMAAEAAPGVEQKVID